MTMRIRFRKTRYCYFLFAFLFILTVISLTSISLAVTEGLYTKNYQEKLSSLDDKLHIHIVFNETYAVMYREDDLGSGIDAQEILFNVLVEPYNSTHYVLRCNHLAMNTFKPYNISVTFGKYLVLTNMYWFNPVIPTSVDQLNITLYIDGAQIQVVNGTISIYELLRDTGKYEYYRQKIEQKTITWPLFLCTGSITALLIKWFIGKYGREVWL